MITLEQAVEAGCRYFLRRATLDMEAVALELAVSRATLYRVVGSRDRLLTEILWRFTSRAVDRARARRTHDGIEGVLEVVRHVARQMLATQPLRRFIASEPETAHRVLVTVQQRGIAVATALFDEVGLGKQSPYGSALPGLVDDPHQVAYLLVRIVEALCFAELAGARPDLDLTEQTIRGLLLRACTPRQPQPSTHRVPVRLARMRDAAMCLVWTSMPEMLLTQGQLSVAVSGV